MSKKKTKKIDSRLEAYYQAQKDIQDEINQNKKIKIDNKWIQFLKFIWIWN